jgi:iron complex transport system substrate-binding protein
MKNFGELFSKFRRPAVSRVGALVIALGVSVQVFAVRVIADETGHKVTLPDHAHRIICLTPSVTDTVYAIGAGADVVGITDYTMYPAQARQKPSIGGVLRPSLERIAVLHPDVVIGVAGFNDSETIRGVERMGVPVFLVHASGIEGVYSSIASVGSALGRERESAALIAQLRNRERKVRLQAQAGKHPAVFFAISVDPCITAGHRAFLTELIDATGARSVTEDIAQEWANVSIEAIIPRKPDFVLLLKDSPFGLNEMRAHAGWRSLEAVRDDRLQYPSPVAFDALEDLARQLRSAESR